MPKLHGAPAICLSPCATRTDIPKEYWLVHPVDRVLTSYRLEGGAYGRPLVSELQGRSGCRACPGAEVDWEHVVKGLPPVSGAG